MRAVVCRELGAVDRLAVEEVASPALAAGQVRLGVLASGVNFVDALVAQGLYQVKPQLPYVPGTEAAGVITEIAPDVRGLAVGDRVLARLASGGFADEVVALATQITPAPRGLSDGQVATFTQSYMTAWFALSERGHAKSGEVLLVLGAGSGVGLAAVDVGRALGMRVVAVASTPEKRLLAQRQGAESTIDAGAPSLREEVRAVCPDGVDITYDPIGGPLAEHGLRALRADGRFLVVGFASGVIPNLPANQVLLRNRHVTGVELGSWLEQYPGHAAELRERMVAAIESGTLHPVEPQVYPLDKIGEVLGLFTARAVVGKVAVVP